jgi:hypothetical protein
MKRKILATLAALAVWASAGLNFAAAQGFGTLGQQSSWQSQWQSPWQNQPRLPPAFGAPSFQPYGVIRNQTDANRLALDQQGLPYVNPDGTLKVPIAPPDASTTSALGGLTTGHTAGFFDFGGYFPLVPPGGSGTGTVLTGFGSGITGTPYGGSSPRFLFGVGANRFRSE